MGRKEVQACISSTGLPCAHLAWDKGSVPSLPWCVYREDSTDGLYADNANYSFVTRWAVELYERIRDEEIEASVEEALTREFNTFSRYETWLEDEGCLMVTYTFTEC